METPSAKTVQNTEQKELALEEKLALAYKMTQTSEDLNRFIEGYGGFDTFAESWANLKQPRADYDRLQDAANTARNEFNEKVADKAEIVLKLREAGRDRVADRIITLFGGKPSLKEKVLSFFNFI